MITRDGQACVGDFGIAGTFGDLWSDQLKLGAAQYIAPECFSYVVALFRITGLSKASDVYSLVMTSFEVRSPVVNLPVP